MNDQLIVITALELDRDVMSIRTWWVLDSRLAGNPLSVFLYFRALGTGARITQKEAAQSLGLGEWAFRSAREKLRRAGFMIEIRDRHPKSYRDPSTGEPKGGQARYRLVFLDPPPGVEVPDSESIIEADSPVDIETETPVHKRSWKSRTDASTGLGNQEWPVKPQVRGGLGNQERVSADLGFQEPLEEDTGIWTRTGNRNKDFNPIPSDPGARTAREAAPGEIPAVLASTGSEMPIDAVTVDVELAAVHPSLSVASLEREVRGRLELAGLDLPRACREILEANRKPGGATNPPAYVAVALLAAPDRYRATAPYIPASVAPSAAPAPHPARKMEQLGRQACERGEHDWGPAIWREVDRSACVRCFTPRRRVDPEFAALEEQLDPVGGDT